MFAAIDPTSAAAQCKNSTDYTCGGVRVAESSPSHHADAQSSLNKPIDWPLVPGTDPAASAASARPPKQNANLTSSVPISQLIGSERAPSAQLRATTEDDNLSPAVIAIAISTSGTSITLGRVVPGSPPQSKNTQRGSQIVPRPVFLLFLAALSTPSFLALGLNAKRDSTHRDGDCSRAAGGDCDRAVQGLVFAAFIFLSVAPSSGGVAPR
ncbi:MAG: hypothetical protein FRX48_06581 [Lasallia pustulata]|uniref:Uncharacterized protein n=1 Tax=Lasallia pustulata TaxID=136370 RepID=A0A5M8PKM1_9LECA|nr:MAG: hypothetical protein FRX48_06581 [Lasallia pustulata]